MSDSVYRLQQAITESSILRSRAAPVGFACAVCVLLMATVRPLATARAEDNGAERSIEFRRVFVPSDNVSVWPRGGEKFLPVATRDFDAWIAAANASEADLSSPVSITQATYWARWKSKQNFAGRGEWTIALRSGGPEFLALNQMSLVAREFRWQDAPKLPVRFGAWGSDAASMNTLGLEVSRSGTLEFEWHAPTNPAHDGIEIPWHLPIATSNCLFLDLPSDKRPVLDGSVLVEEMDAPIDLRTAESQEVTATTGERSNSTKLGDETVENPLSTNSAPGLALPDAQINPPGWRRWVLLLGPESRANLRIVEEEGEPAPTTPTVQLREQLNYQVTDRGVELLATLHLTDSISPRRELRVALPFGVQLISATVDGQELPWRISGSTPLGESKAIVELPGFAATRSLTVALRAWHSLIIDRQWQLPKLRPEDVFWSSGAIDISIAPGLELKALTPTDCQQTSLKLVDFNSDRPETWSLTPYSPTAKVEVSLGRRPPDATARVGTTIQIGDPDVTARLVTELQVNRGSIHKLIADFEPDWLIEGIETIPASALGKWYVDGRSNRRSLELQLAGPAQPKQSVTVIVTGRLRRPSNTEPLLARTLGMLRWRDLKLWRSLALIDAVQPYNVEAVGILPNLSSDELTADDRSLFNGPIDSPVFDLLKAGEDAAIRQTVERNVYSAEIQIDAEFTGSELRQSYGIICRPKSSRVDRLLVFVSGSLGEDVRWIDTSSGAQLVAEHLPADDPRTIRFPSGGEYWLVHLKRPASGTTEINTTRITRWQDRKALPLLALPEAAEQQGRVSIRAAGAHAAFPEPSDLQATPMPLVPANQPESGYGGRIQAMYRYEPAKCLAAVRRPVLWLRPSATAELPPSVAASRVELESFVSPDGSCAHRAKYRLENRGADFVNFTLSASVQIESAEINGNTIKFSAAPGLSGKLLLPLPRDSRFVTLTLCLTSKISPLGRNTALAPPLAVADFPIVGGNWRIWLPDDCVALGANLFPAYDTISWRQRLFGLLGRSEDTRPFDMLHAAEWPFWKFDATTESSAIAAAREPQSAARADEVAVQPTRAGWHAYHQTFVAGPPAQIEITRPALATAWSFVILLFAIVAGALIRNWRREWYISMTAFAAALCLMLPPTVVPLATGAFGGLLLSLLADWPDREASRDAPTQSWRRTRIAITAITLVLLHASSVFAEPAEPPPSTSRQATVDSVSNQTEAAKSIHPVLIPIDTSGKQTGDKVYLGETFLRELLRRSSSPSLSTRRWLISDASCQGELISRPDAPGLIAGNWKLTLAIEVFARDTTLELPLNRGEAIWSSSAMLDGIPTPVTWQAEGRNCSIAVSEPGRYELEISCVPKTRDMAGGRARVELAVPPFPGTAIKLSFPPTANMLELSGARRVERGGATAGTLWAELDGTGRMVVDWPQQLVPDGGAQDRRITELYWLRVEGDGIFLHAKYHFEGPALGPEVLSISADPRWELIAMKDGSSAVAQEVAETSSRRTIRIALPDRDADRSEVALRFRLTGDALLGRHQLPLIELQSLPATQSWLAITSDESHECEMLDSRESSGGSVDEFLNFWGDEEVVERPQFVLSNVLPGTAGSLSVRPRTSESEIDEILHVAVGAATMRVQYQANVVPDIAHRCQFTLSVPADLAIEEVTQSQAGRDIPLRWVRSADNRVQVFFGTVATDPYRLTLAGHLPVDKPSACPLPRIGASLKDSTSERIELYREQGALIEVLGLEDDLAKDQAVESPPVKWSARPLCAFQLDRAAAEKVRLAISQNLPETDGDTLTSLTRDENGWSASFRCHLLVKRGILDTLQLRIPTDWVGPFEIHPSTSATVSLAPLDTQHSLLVVNLPKPIESGRELELEISGPLASSAVLTVAVPNVGPNTPAEWKRYIAVPASSNLQPSDWTTLGTEPEELPAEFRRSIPDPAAVRTFRVVAEPFRVALEPPQSTQPAAIVRLADTVVITGSDGRDLIVTRFSIAPQNLMDCNLRLPDDQELVSVSLDSRPANVCSIDGQRWRVKLGPPQMPQWLEVISRTIVGPAPSGRVVELQRPALLAGESPLAVEMSLWSFRGTQPNSNVHVVGASRTSALEQMAARLDRLVSIAESATPTAAAAPIPEGYDWYYPWSVRLAAIRNDAQALSTPSTGPQIIADTSDSAEAQLAKSSLRVGSWIEQCESVLEGAGAGAPAQAASEVHFGESVYGSRRGIEWTYCVADGGAERLTIEFLPTGVAPSQMRTGLLLAIVGLAVASIWAVRQPAARDLFWRWPQAVGVLIGLAYWAWLWPSSLGLLIVGLSLLMLLHRGTARRSIRAESTTVLRLASRP